MRLPNVYTHYIWYVILFTIILSKCDYIVSLDYSERERRERGDGEEDRSKKRDRKEGIGQRGGREEKRDFVTSDFHAKSLKHSLYAISHPMSEHIFFSCLYFVNIMKHLSFSYIIYIYFF